jgi:hypothetical protein
VGALGLMGHNGNGALRLGPDGNGARRRWCQLPQNSGRVDDGQVGNGADHLIAGATAFWWQQLGGGAVAASMRTFVGSMGAVVRSSMGAFDGLMEAIVISSMGAVCLVRASVGLMGVIVVVSMVGNLMLEDDSKWLDGLILGTAGQLEGAES